MKPEKLVKLACFPALIGLALMLWFLVDPRPVPTVLAMSVGQLFGTLALCLYVLAVIIDLRRARVLSSKPK